MNSHGLDETPTPKEDDELHRWEIEPHPDTSYDTLVTDSDRDALQHIIGIAERYLWDDNEPGQERIMKVRMNDVPTTDSTTTPTPETHEAGAAAQQDEADSELKPQEDSLLERLRRELSFYFGAYHGQLKHSRDAVACQESGCVRLRQLLYEPDTHADSFREWQPAMEEIRGFFLAIRAAAEVCNGDCDDDPCIWSLAQQGTELVRTLTAPAPPVSQKGE